MSFEKSVSLPVDPVGKRREAMTDILASWDLEGAMPDVTGLRVVHEYVVGRLELPWRFSRSVNAQRSSGRKRPIAHNAHIR
ncbi:hypothetical protein ACW0JT_18160 [Arthrobacter sp. SA17]